jgi:hypothetical protein
LADSTIITETIEKYSQLALLLFCPCRKLKDITLDGSFTRRLRAAATSGVFSTKAQDFLQNIQDTKSNSFRVSNLQDDLQRNTEPLHAVHASEHTLGYEEHSNEEVEEAVGKDIDTLLNVLALECGINGETQIHEEEDSSVIPQSISFQNIRQKGCERCGYECLAQMQTSAHDPHASIVEVGTERHDLADGSSKPCSTVQDKPPTFHDIVKVLINRKTRRCRTFQAISTNDSAMVTVLEANGSAESVVDWARQANLDRDQRRAFEIIICTFLLTFFETAPPVSEGRIPGMRHVLVSERRKLSNLGDVKKRGSSQLLCLLHGPGGSGKTTVIDLIVAYASEYCSFLDNYEFSSRTILVTAMTGVAATILLGETTHGAVYLNQKKPIEAEQVELWTATRLLVIDEISFASKDDFSELHKKIRLLKQNMHSPYGGLSIIFSGDMRQLEPVGSLKKPVYAEDCPEFKDWVNCFIELKGMHRFKQDPEWGELLLRFRDGNMTETDLQKINERVVNPATVLPEDIKYATFFNRDRDSINAALFEERCNYLYSRNPNKPITDSIMIFSDDLQVQNSSDQYIPFINSTSFWEKCAEDDIKMPRGSGRMDPVLKLYLRCRLMLPCNTSVKDGLANGTQATLEKVVLKPGQQSRCILLGGQVPVLAVHASQVSHIVLRHSNERITPPTFTVRPKLHSFRANILKPRMLQVGGKERELLKMKATQLPVIINNATTGHKLQGTGVDCLFVHNWSYVTNWVYVMLSRVKTRAGLFCRKPLSTDTNKYTVPKSLTNMLDQFRARATPTYWDEDDYNELVSR